MIYCLVYVYLTDGRKAILNKISGDITVSPLVRRKALLIRDQWRGSIEPQAQVAVSYQRPPEW